MAHKSLKIISHIYNKKSKRMNSIKIFFNLIVTILILSACTKSIDFEGKITTPKVVVHSFINPDSVVSAYVSLSAFFLSDTLLFKQVYNADVSLYINGKFKEKMNRVYSSRAAKYKGTYQPAISDRVKIVVKVPEMDEVYAETAIIKAPLIEAVDTTVSIIDFSHYIESNNDTIAVGYQCNVNLKIKFTNRAEEKNFYRLIVMKRFYEYKPITVWDNSLRNWKWALNEITTDYYGQLKFTDPVNGNITNLNPLEEVSAITGESIDAAETYNVFSDELINGKSYTLNCTATNVSIMKRYPGYEKDTEKGKHYGYQGEKTEVFVSLQSISEEYYYYLKTRGASGKDDFFSEPVQILSNIKGGIGFMGAYTTSNVFSFMIE